jgi:hypothetical protein
VLAKEINQPNFPHALRSFIHLRNHPGSNIEPDDSYDGPIWVYHSANASFYAPSDLCGAGGMYHQRLRANPSFKGESRYDTVFVNVGGPKEEMKGLLVARLLLLFSCYDPYSHDDIPCALVRWFVHPKDSPKRDDDTGMWKLVPETDEEGNFPVDIISLDAILRGAHLLPIFGKGYLQQSLHHTDALDAFDAYYVNQFIDYHCHELLFQ